MIQYHAPIYNNFYATYLGAALGVAVCCLSVRPSVPVRPSVLRFFGRYPAMGIDPLLPECHGTSSESLTERWIICGVLHGRN